MGSRAGIRDNSTHPGCVSASVCAVLSPTHTLSVSMLVIMTAGVIVI